MHLKSLSSAFVVPSIISGLILVIIGIFMGLTALGTAALLVVLEISLSFDNAIVNAGVLKHMSALWRARFMTWGIVLAVFITRAILPMLTVSASARVSPIQVAWLALYDPAQYGVLLASTHYTINAFGAMFLLMVGFSYFFDADKTRHWLHAVERRLSRWGSVQAIEMISALGVLIVCAWLIPLHATEILAAGCVGILAFTITHGLAKIFAGIESSAKSGFALFLYLSVLDVAFSLDSVIGAFALSTNLIVILVGLGIGAYFVRTLTISMVEHGTLDSLIYIEHGAHWAILGLAGVMVASLFVEVPEPVTGLIGLGFIVAAYVSSSRTAMSSVRQS